MRAMTPHDIRPTLWQKRLWYASLTAVAVAVLLVIVTMAGTLVVRALAFLQPLLIPVVVAVILTYLLSPAVTKFCAWGLSRTWAVLLLMLLLAAGFAGVVLWVAPAISHEAVEFGRALPEHTARGEKWLLSTLEWGRGVQQRFQPDVVEDAERSVRAEVWSLAGAYVQQFVDWVQLKLPEIATSAVTFLKQSIGGFLGIAGIALSLLLVPLFLFFFLKDSDKLAADWRKYIPLPDSPLKEEVASLVEEINNYLLRYFRGQFMVSLIDGALIGTALLLMGMNFALLIGLAVGVLAMIPYLGMLICWIPAVLIAAAQFGDWTHPLIVTLIFIGMNNLEGFFISPHIVGESVSLRPFTVIMSVLVWSLVLGGLLGALLAVPLTATLKVLLQRYVWRARF
jgi:predicted PurR-regulated permease PerM